MEFNTGQRFKDGPLSVHDRVNTIARVKYWNQPAIIISWDDAGGHLDHVPPPKWLVCPDGHACGNGQRVPLLLISPFARTGVVYEFDDQSSLIKFVERLVNRAPLRGSQTKRVTRPSGRTTAANSPAICRVASTLRGYEVSGRRSMRRSALSNPAVQTE